jgi:squalene-associated FAD-dependent desaturase
MTGTVGPTSVVVVGGGLAGITAAIALRDAGLDVTLTEARPRLGGAASSFRRGDLIIDNGQHVMLRCCTSYAGLLERLGATGKMAVQERFDVTVLSPDGPARLRRTNLPGPLHMLPALARYRLATPAQRLKASRAALAMRFADPADPALDRVALGDWLAARGQAERARRVLWDLFIVSALNIAGDDASLPLAATVIKTALLGARDAADIGVASVPLGDLHDKAAGALLASLGVTVRLATRVTSVEPLPGGGFAIDLATSEGDAADDGNGQADAAAPGQHGAAGRLQADAVVLAVPSGQAARLGAAAGITGASRWDDLGASPIVNVHVVYDRPVTDLPFAAAIDSPVQWVFDKTSQSGLAAGQYLAVSLSAADDYIDVPVAALREQFVPALRQLFPAAGQAAVTDFFVTRERRATFRQIPGSGALRPAAATPVRGLVLAGAWTDTGWPDTMEGAVISGHNGAQELVRQIAAGQIAPAAALRPAGAGSRLGAAASGAAS